MKFKGSLNSGRTRLFLSFALLLLLVLVLVTVVVIESYRIYAVDLERQERSTETYEVVQQLKVNLLNIETGKRGYLLSNNDSFLEPYRAGRSRFEDDLRRLRSLNSGSNIIAARDIERLEAQYATVIALFERQIELRGAGSRDPEDLLVEDTKPEMDEARSIFTRMEGQALLARNDAIERTRDSVRAEMIVAIALGLLSLLLGLISLAYVRRGIVSPLERLRDDARKTSAALEARERGMDGGYDALTRWRDENREVRPGASELEEVRQAFVAMVGQIQLQSERVRTLVEGIEDPLFTVNKEGRITYFNEAAGAMISPEPTEREFRDGVALFGLQKSLVRAMALDEIVRGSEEILDFDDGRVTYVSSTSSPLHDRSGEVIGGLKILRDFTARKQAEAEAGRARMEAEEANRAKSRFLANMSHEIRTPMNGVIGMTELLLSTKLTDEQRDYAATAQSSGETLLSIINDILDFSKIEAGRLDIENVPYDLEDLVENTIAIFAGRLQQKGVELVCYMDARLPKTPTGDPVRVRQILTNLLGNAAKFTEEGEIVISVERGGSGDDRMLLGVRDTGIGMSEEQQESIFDSFSQADGSVTRRYGGTGLGLAITRQLSELMGGSIRVASRPGIGSEFHVDLPLVSSPSEEPRDTGFLADRSILLVVRNTAARLSLARMLSGWGADVADCEAPTEALFELRDAALGGSPHDLVITDSSDVAGFRHAIAKDAGGPHIGFIALSPVGIGSDEIRRMKDSDIFDCLTKPVRRSSLRRTLTSYFSPQRERVPRNEARSEFPEVSSGERPEGDSPLVLVVEDNPVNQRVASRMLERLGCEVEVVVDGFEAVEAASRERYSLIFMDVQMPRMGGYEATKEIRTAESSRAGDHPRTPIIAMTANALHSDREEALACGMDDHLPKPIRSEDLHNALRRWAIPRSKAPNIPATTGQEIPKDAILDPAILVDLRSLQDTGDHKLLEELVHIFEIEFTTRISELRDNLTEGDISKARETAHAMKGSAASLGARRVAASLRELETLLHEGSTAGTVAILEKLEKEFTLARERLEEEVDPGRLELPTSAVQGRRSPN